MTDTNKILIGVGALGVLGTGIYLLVRKPSTTTTTVTENPTVLNDPSTSTIDSLGTTFGNLFTELWGKKKREENNITDCNPPADPYSFDGITASSYSRSQNETMQTKLSNINPAIKEVIDNSGGADGIIGPGFKTAYNMARKSCLIDSISNIL